MEKQPVKVFSLLTSTENETSRGVLKENKEQQWIIKKKCIFSTLFLFIDQELHSQFHSKIDSIQLTVMKSSSTSTVATCVQFCMRILISRIFTYLGISIHKFGLVCSQIINTYFNLKQGRMQSIGIAISWIHACIQYIHARRLCNKVSYIVAKAKAIAALNLSILLLLDLVDSCLVQLVYLQCQLHKMLV